MKTMLAATLHDSSLVSKVGDWINETINDIHARTNFAYVQVSTSFNTVQGQQEYSFSSIQVASKPIEKMLYVRDRANKISLEEISYATLYDENAAPEDDTQGNPLAYYTKDEVVGLWPIPGSAITLYVDYKKITADLTADSDTPDLPIPWTDVIVLGAEARGLRYLKREDWTATHALYENEVRRRIAALQLSPNRRFRFKKQEEKPNNFGPFFPRDF